MKTKLEKLKLAAQLLDQDKSYRVIAKRTHLSLTDISALKKQKFGDDNSQTADNKYTAAYKLFKQKKHKLIDVAIELGLDEKITTKFWREYCHLENIDDLIRIYDILGPGLSSLLELYKVMKEQELAPKDVDYVAQKLIDIQELEQHEENLKSKIKEMQSQKIKLGAHLDGMQRQWGLLEKYVDELTEQIELLEGRLRGLRENKLLEEELD